MADSFKLTIKGGKTEVELNGVPIVHLLQSVRFEATAFGNVANIGIVVPLDDVVIEADDCDVIIAKV